MGSEAEQFAAADTAEQGRTGPARVYSAAEQWADRIVHWLGIAVAVSASVGLLLLAFRQSDLTLSISVMVYALGLIAMLACSAICNYDLSEQSRYAELFKRLDHSGILFMIAATYTPFTLIAMGGPWGWGLFAFVWTLALGGIVLKLATRGPLRHGISIGIYLVLGWSVLAALQPLISAVSLGVLLLLLAGGVLYSSGVVFYLWKRLPFHVPVWHSFVIAAAGCHYTAVLLGVVSR
ncbi:MAG: hemolysin III family protein [Ectothiorhodospiraceae bacterium]|nr:hemolysin III family protein [Ectothiorhodospiraceae bacterium]MCH8507056.1 hemolysin III family protein [Ectothiorhodospiraceae bacterium]